MAIVTRQQDISVHVDPISFTADIEVLSGNLAQTYNNDTKEYEPDRGAVPCLIMPYVVVSDPEGNMNGKQALTGVEWYEGAPKQDGSNRISNNSDYVISDSSTPKYSLKIKKNVEPNTPMQIFAVFTIEDTRKNTEVKFERSVNLYTALYDIKNYALRVNQPKSWTIDPIRVKPNSTGEWYFSITSRLYSGMTPVPDENAAYWWQINVDQTGWREPNSDELALCIFGKKGANWDKTISFDARFFRNISFRCLAKYYVGQRPSTSDSSLSVVVNVSVQMPKSLNVVMRQLSGSKISSDMTTPVSFECVILDNRQVIPSEKDNLFQITWKAHSAKPGVQDKEIGGGRTISFIPSTLGFDKKYAMSIYAEVKLYAVTALVTQGKKVLMSNKKAVIATKYE